MTHRPDAHAIFHHYIRLGFSLIEILVVLVIIMLLLGLAFAIPKSQEREAHVRGAAEELAAVLRETRTRAMRQNHTLAVVFNIENAPGSSGKILNNRSGGHWYRVLGPADATFGGYSSDGDGVSGKPPLFNQATNFASRTNYDLPGVTWYSPGAIQHYLELVSRCWIDEPHVLAKGKVRFLALTDQDNGDNYVMSQGTHYTASYPRPWFGWWDAGTQEMRTWGGYDPTLTMTTFGESRWPFTRRRLVVNGRPASHSGFYYEGWEGLITGCVNPADRMAPEDLDMNGVITQGFSNPDPTLAKPDELSSPSYTVLKQGEPRPLINGNWVDFAILFHPNGTVETDWFRLRQGGYSGGSSWTFPAGDPLNITYPQVVPSTPPTLPVSGNEWIYRDYGLGDLCNTYANDMHFSDNTPYPFASTSSREATDYVHRTGYYFISLAPDATNDKATFPSADAALKAMLPLYRVGVSPNGNVIVIRVRTTNYDNKTFDTAITGNDWEDPRKVWGKASATWNALPPTMPNYQNHTLREASGAPRGSPIFDVVLPEMLRDRKWWWDTP